MLWDVDGTLAETERDGHLVAFNAAFAERGVPWRWTDADYGELLRVAGGRERLAGFVATVPESPRDPAERDGLVRDLHLRKNELYAQLVAEGRIPLRPGVRALMDECDVSGTRMAIVTTTSRGNVAALLAAHLGADWERRFAAVVTAEDAPRKKPDPEAYVRALALLELAADEAIAIEDSPAGLASARAVGIPVVVTRSRYFVDADVAGALAVGPGLHTTAGWEPATRRPSGRIDLAQLRAWHGAGVTVGA